MSEIGLAVLGALALLLTHRRRGWRHAAFALPVSLTLSLAVRFAPPALAVAAHALFPATRAWLVWRTHLPRSHFSRAIVLGYVIAALVIGATWSASWRAPLLYAAALTATRWVAAALVMVAWTGATKDEGPPQATRATAFCGRRTTDPGTGPKREHSTLNAPRAVALILGGGHACGLLGAWMLGDPWRDWYLARGLTWAEYVVCGIIMSVALVRKT